MNYFFRALPMDITIFHPLDTTRVLALDKHQIDPLDTKIYPCTFKIHPMDMAKFQCFFNTPGTWKKYHPPP